VCVRVYVRVCVRVCVFRRDFKCWKLQSWFGIKDKALKRCPRVTEDRQRGRRGRRKWEKKVQKRCIEGASELVEFETRDKSYWTIRIWVWYSSVRILCGLYYVTRCTASLSIYSLHMWLSVLSANEKLNRLRLLCSRVRASQIGACGPRPSGSLIKVPVKLHEGKKKHSLRFINLVALC